MSFSVLELCAGGGGQALGLEMAGFHHAAAVEYEAQFCTTLRLNRPHWDVKQQDIRDLRPSDFKGVDLLAAGVPCPPFSIAGKQLGEDDDRDMFPAAMEIIRGAKPRGVLFENVPGLASAKFSEYRDKLLKELSRLGYQPEWKVLSSSHFGVPQLRPRFVLIALQPRDAECFRWPSPQVKAVHVGETLVDLMAENGWDGAEAWAQRAAGVAPTLVGGSKKHGGPDLGPTRAKRQWRELGVDGMGIADEAPDVTFPPEGYPRLTVRMVARIQSFPDSWEFSGRKTISYRQVGNAFPPNVARAVGLSIVAAFKRQSRYTAASESATFEPRLLEKPRSICQSCGYAAGDPDPFNTSRTIRLTMGHIIDKSKGGPDTFENLRAVCTNCNEGLQNASLPRPGRIQILSQVRRATIDDQLALLEWLLMKFRLVASPKPEQESTK